ncbi:MAG: PQQ-binding-like beta-propeller repeat protein [Richelia sp. SM1_7_0]|nr:PQQ-binding-like beta-propeller repeat protein [Richelia sp. SM1_7_0]
MNKPIHNSGIGQQVENSEIHGGIQATQGNKNVQVHGEGNILTFNQTEILQISEKQITSRVLIISSPYKGLKTFESRDKELFFGRDNFITTLVDELEHTNLILLFGPSGSGKSSVVRAGLIPWLERKYRTGFINLTFTPDADPFDSFYTSLRTNKYQQAEVNLAREVKEETLIQVVNNLKKSSEFWLIFIDQFEELFTISDEHKRREFINGLMKLSQAKLPGVKIMATMRADFLERLSDFPQLVEATQKHRPMIVKMQSNELRLAIEQPAAHHGMIFETGLVDKIITEVQGQAGCLPLLQYTLKLLWEEEVRTGSINDRVLNTSTYEDLGGVTGALQQHVDSIYDNLSPSEKLAGQRIFLKLVGIGESAESGIEWKPVRRRALLSEFRDDERDVLLKLVNENLLVSDADLSKTDSKKELFRSSKSVKSNSTIEITHEILLTCWDKLDNWIQNNRQGIALRNRLYEDVKRWQNKKPEDELWTGSKLEQILELRKDDNFYQVLGGFNDEANRFINASVGLRDRQLKRARMFALIGSTLAGLASVATVYALIQQQEAQEQSIMGIIQSSESRLLANSQLYAMKEAIKAKKQSDSLWIKDQNTRTQVDLALLNTVHSLAVPNTLGGHANWVNAVSFSPNGKMLASASSDNTVKLWNSETGKEIRTLTGHIKVVQGVSFSPNGKMLVSVSSDRTIKLWDAYTGKLIKTLTGHTDSVNGISFSPDGKTIASASGDNTVKLWNTNTGELIKILAKHTNFVLRISFSPDGKTIASASGDNTIKLWDADTGKEIKTLRGHQNVVRAVSFSANGKTLASASDDKTVKLWNTDTGEPIKTLAGQKSEVYGISFSPDGKMLASASRDSTVKLWNTDSGELIKTLIGHGSTVYGVSFSPDGKTIASASADNTVKFWNTDTGKEVKTLAGHKNYVNAASFSPDGKMLASASGDQTVKLWDAETGKLIKTLTGHENYVNAASFSPNGKMLASASGDKTVKLWDTDSGKVIRTLIGHGNTVHGVSFSPDGKILASASGDKTIKLWNTDSGRVIKTLREHTSEVIGVSFNPDGKILASASRDGTVKLWHTYSGELIQTLAEHGDTVNGVSFSPDGKMLVSASADKTVKLWDTSSGKLIKTLIGHTNFVYKVSFSRDGKMLASVGADNTVKLWKWDVDYLLKEGCDFMREYFKTYPPEDESEKKMCDGVGM